MAKGKDWAAALRKLEGAITETVNPFTNGISSPSPSVNFIYGKSWMLPFGFSEVLYGPPKGGKTVLVLMKIGRMHQEDPNALAVIFDTEFRNQGQLTKETAQMYGIDLNRLIVYQVNQPALIFDRIEQDIRAMCEEGAPVKYIAIDSISGILGRREMNSDSIDNQQIGDHALTVQIGLKRILPTQRKYKIAITLVTQVRAEMDAQEQRMGNKLKMNASWGLQHYGEYFVFVAPNRSKDGRTSLTGDEMINKELTDLMDKGEKTGHKIRVTMKDSSMGPKGRTGEFTFDYDRGIINVHEEVFLLGVNRGVIESPTQGWYCFGGKKWHGVKDMVTALKDNPSIQAAITTELRRRDLAGKLTEQEVVSAAEIEAE